MFERYDVVVAGGGLSGVQAALAAARLGARVLLAESSPSLGGRLFRTLDWLDGAGDLPLSWPAPVPMDPWERVEQWRRDLADAGVQVLTGARVYGAVLQNGMLTQAAALTCEGSLSLSGRVYVDATGLGSLAHACHVPSHMGREGDGQLLPPTFTFLAQGASTALLEPEALIREAREACPALLELRTQPLEEPGLLRVTLSTRLCPYGFCALDTARAEGALRDMVRPVLELLRRHGLWEGQLLRTGTGAYFPEGLHIQGRHCLDGGELARGLVHPDAILTCRGSGHDYTIPYRSLLPLRVKNLLLAGRSIAGTQETLLRTGSPAVSMALGEVAGIAAALALGHGARPRRVEPGALLAAREKLARPSSTSSGPAAEPIPASSPLPVEGDLMASLAGLLDDPPAASPVQAASPTPSASPVPVVPAPAPAASPSPSDSRQLWEPLPCQGEDASEGAPFYIPQETPPWS